MKKIAIALVVLALIAGFVAYNVWRGSVTPVTTPPTLVDLGRQQLRAQLQQSAQRESEIEQQDWNSITLLRDVIKAHQHRIEQLSGNAEAAEIIAHDKEAIARLEKRIQDLAAQEAAQRVAQNLDTSGAQDGTESATAQDSHPSTRPSQPQPAPSQHPAQTTTRPQSTPVPHPAPQAQKQ